MYSPALVWRFSAAPLLQSDLAFIMEELDRCYNRAVNLAKRLNSSQSDLSEGCFHYPLVERFLMTKRSGRSLLHDDFQCSLRVGLLTSDLSVPEQVQCKLIAVGVFYLLSMVNLVVFISLVPVVIYSGLRPLLCHECHFLETYQSLPTVSVLPAPAGQWDDLSLCLLFLEENISELKSFKYIKVLELLRKRSGCAGEDFDSMGLLQTLGLVKTDNVDSGLKAAQKTNNCESSGPAAEGSADTHTELKELRPLLTQKSDQS
ncbi:hypothetical protein WMY93_003382 [Mugilogobius chulae]|uniref:Pannexin 1 n=1 Tax=Mugilogobius chulae TaxID=88201 RepID=A0AAW0QBH7_9GOBI